MIYLDNSATTFPKPECVYDAVDHFSRTQAVSAGPGAHRAARLTRYMVQEVREQLISLVDGQDQAEVVLTPSVTVALNQIIHGQRWTADSVVYVSPYEHNAILRPLELLRKAIGFSLYELPLAPDLSIDLAATEKRFQDHRPDFVAMSAISNVTGYILPVSEVFQLAKSYGAFTLLEASQALGLLNICLTQTHADVISFAGHKTLYAPFGIGGFFVRDKVNLDVLLTGDPGVDTPSAEMPQQMPDNLECTSKDMVAICGLNRALKWLSTVDPLTHDQELTQYLFSRLPEVPGIHIYAAPGGLANQAGVVSVNLDGFRASEVAAILDSQYDIAVQAGHHGAALIHAYLEDQPFDGTVRISFGYFNTQRDVDALVVGLKGINREQLKTMDADILRGDC